ncbi:(d)CMP kinase [Thermophagus xiamenensis]|uniref:Cytidylate kinase n=1 Tax=Thermophagus xiamenensis TaxID=385682 RepID=A0A1I2CHB1_9BACT|nr:(d)CMP kinase [Thermophagus xiamenensis]SFE67532.1 cytidylate kinase [Thermophagus xiamenensis]
MKKDIRSIIIAIDGHSSCGKSTVARDLAKMLNIAYIDTGAMYRAVTLFALRQNMIVDGKINEEQLRNNLENIVIDFRLNPDKKLNETYLNGENVEEKIRSLEVSNNVSPISALGFVRKHLVALQRRMGEKGGVVLDGRDIGTVVFPNADLKIFMTASPEIRAKRRYDEMVAKGLTPKFEEILENIKERDKIDSTRSESPLKQADDALVLDNSHMTRREQLEWILNKINDIDKSAQTEGGKSFL